MLQRLAPVASRAENIFTQTCEKYLRFTMPPNLKETIKTLPDPSDLSSILKVCIAKICILKVCILKVCIVLLVKINVEIMQTV